MAQRGTTPRRLFALDHNFPIPIVRALGQSVPEAELVPISEIDARLPDMNEDWRVLLALHHHPRPWDGLITTDSGMLSLARELSVLLQTSLTLVVAQGAGHDPLRATGLVLTHLPHICTHTTPDSAQIWTLSAATKGFVQPWVNLARLARHEKATPAELHERSKLSDAEFSTNPLEQ